VPGGGGKTWAGRIAVASPSVASNALPAATAATINAFCSLKIFILLIGFGDHCPSRSSPPKNPAAPIRVQASTIAQR
jgi:hypothetical protein